MISSEKKLFVLGDLDTVMFFRLIGAQAIVVASEQEFGFALKTIKENIDTIGGIVVSNNLATLVEQHQLALHALNVPAIVLPPASSGEPGQSPTKILEELTEKALGMKLERDISL